VRFRDLLTRIRLRPLQGKGERPIDNPDALSFAPTENLRGVDSGPGPTAPTNWVPSQQDDRPRH
jgi:hypothetical protein